MTALDERLKLQDSVKLINVIEVQVSEEIARKRVLGRARGADDNTEVFNNRMQVYLSPLQQIKAFYKDILHSIDGERTIQEIVGDMESFIKSRI